MVMHSNTSHRSSASTPHRSRPRPRSPPQCPSPRDAAKKGGDMSRSRDSMSERGGSGSDGSISPPILQYAPQYAGQLHDEPSDSGSLAESSEDSMLSGHSNQPTPSDSPPHPADSPGHAAAASHLGRMSLDTQEAAHDAPRTYSDRLPLAQQTTCMKRGADTDVDSRPRKQTTPVNPAVQHAQMEYREDESLPLSLADGHPSSLAHPQDKHIKREPPFHPLPRDSGYETAPSRQNTSAVEPNLAKVSGPSPGHGNTTRGRLPKPDHKASQKRYKSPKPQGDEETPLLQPPTKPISPNELAAEIKGIYAGLIVVESKCISIDSAQLRDPEQPLSMEQLQALVALHRTLLYEHHDFLAATQHPAASEGLKSLAGRYNMPQRMWKHGIHSVLEVMRRKKPIPYDSMVQYIYLAYQMVALLYESMPCFTDTWIECLGDLARYRMSIEADKEVVVAWGGVASLWYNTSSDRNVDTGRLYHHIGILESPCLRKLFLYSKSLTSSIPFANGRLSLQTLFNTLAMKTEWIENMKGSAEAKFLQFYARADREPEHESLDTLGDAAIARLDTEPTSGLVTSGVFMVCTSIASMLSFGVTTNPQFHALHLAATLEMQQVRHPTLFPPGYNHPNLDLTDATPCIPAIFKVYTNTLNWFVNAPNSTESLQDLLPAIHAILIFLHGIFSLRTRLANHPSIATLCDPLLDPANFSWGGLAATLDRLTAIAAIDSATIVSARQRTLPFPSENSQASRKTIPDDHHLRGLPWTLDYFPKDLFNNLERDEDRFKESDEVRSIRIQRVQWLGVFMALHSEFMNIDLKTRKFSAPIPGPKFAVPSVVDTGDEEVTKMDVSVAESTVGGTGSMDGVSVVSGSEGYAHVKKEESAESGWVHVVELGK